MRAHPPFVGRERGVMEEAQRLGMRRRIGALEARAADHHVGAVLAHIGPHALPQQLERALVAVGLQHAGPAKLHEAVIGLRAEQWRDIVFALRVEAVVEVGDLLAQHAIGADHLGAPPAPPVGGSPWSITSRWSKTAS